MHEGQGERGNRWPGGPARALTPSASRPPSTKAGPAAPRQAGPPAGCAPALRLSTPVEPASRPLPGVIGSRPLEYHSLEVREGPGSGGCGHDRRSAPPGRPKVGGVPAGRRPPTPTPRHLPASPALLRGVSPANLAWTFGYTPPESPWPAAPRNARQGGSGVPFRLRLQAHPWALPCLRGLPQPPGGPWSALELHRYAPRDLIGRCSGAVALMRRLSGPAAMNG